MKEEEQGNRDVIRQIRHIRQFFDHIDAFETAHPEADVRMFLEEFAYILDSGDEGTLPPVVDTPDSVNIMTVHASKGLEYKYVFVVNLVEGRFPGRRRGGGIELPDGLVAHGMDRNPNDAHYDEERRLFYVAATRAKERLYLLSSLDYGGARKKKISRFLHELSFEEEGTTTPQKSDTFEQTPQSALPSDQDEHIYPLPKAFSFSQIRAYESCPYQYKLAHILKIPTRGAASFSFGSTMHNTLHAFYKRVQEMNSATQSSLFDLAPAPTPDDGVQVPTIEALLEMYEKSWIDDWYESAEQKASYRKKGEQILRQLYAAEDGNWTIPVSLEGWFKIQIGDYLLHGRIDRIDQLPDGTLEIIDYKTGKTKEKLSKEDKEQLLIYQIATQMLPEYRHLGDTSKLTFHYVNDDVKTSFIGSPKEIEAIKEKVMSVAAGIHSRNFDPTPDQFTCTYCDFRDICDYRAN
jgi:DNA helicase-2/ATP-dependent DNA helicase PcrA